jgi:RimJ/RimL family protein N-acetyltransferase
MAHACWPLFDLRLTTTDLVLRPLTEADLDTLVRGLPTDLEQNPAFPHYADAKPAEARGTVAYQEHWTALGSWRTDAWRLNFAVVLGHDDGDQTLIGTQELEGNDFVALRTVDTSSLLFERFRGRGLGKQMRRAVLALAFGPLEAAAAITSAWHDNQASLGVSRALGYVDNGVETHRRGDSVDTMVHLRLTRAAWLTDVSSYEVRIENFDACRPYFGLPPRRPAS